jgi:phenylacetate-CoA ligase
MPAMSEAERPASLEVRSAVPGALWPAVPTPGGAAVLALLAQLERTQWLSAGRLLEHQRSQVGALVAHAYATVPYYRERWSALGGGAIRFSGLPLLTRRELQEHHDALLSRRVPPEHGALSESRTSGATGAPVRVSKTRLTALLWNTLTLRDHLWQRRDFAAKLAVIRQGLKPGEAANWGSATAGLIDTGPCAMLGPQADVDTQLDWLLREEPAYLLTYPSNAAELARTSLARGVRPQGLREVRTLGESLDPEVRALCREAWDVPLTDVYSAEEVGYIALQCPHGAHYHVQSEAVLVEVLRDDGAACGPGEIGRVVVTSLHNFAMPLVRYEIGDYAEVGAPCACGRGLPVLRRVLGRVRNMLVSADGKRYWPLYGSRGFGDIAPVLRSQMVQKALDRVELRLVVAAPLSGDQERLLKERALSRLPPGLRLELICVDRIERNAGGKYEDFVSEIGAAR